MSAEHTAAPRIATASDSLMLCLPDCGSQRPAADMDVVPAQAL
jgi:hypothetical protein